MNIVIISGSTRPESQSLKVANVIQSKIAQQGADASVLDLHEVGLPVYDDSKHQKWADLLPDLKLADGFVFVVPEWNGSAAPGIMNFLTYSSVGAKPLAHKPILVVGVSSGAGGAYPIAQVKAFGNKNNYGVHLPDQLRLRNVKDILNSDQPEQGNTVDEYTHSRTEYAIKMLLAYSEKLAQIRDSGIVDLKTFPNGN